MTRSYLAAIGTVILALSIFCPGASAQENAEQPAPTPMNAPPVADQDRMGCEAALQAYDERACDDNCTDECKGIGLDLSKCSNVGNHTAITCKP